MTHAQNTQTKSPTTSDTAGKVKAGVSIHRGVATGFPLLERLILSISYAASRLTAPPPAS